MISNTLPQLTLCHVPTPQRSVSDKGEQSKDDSGQISSGLKKKFTINQERFLIFDHQTKQCGEDWLICCIG